MNTPKDASDSQISELFEMVSAITLEHGAQLKADPSLAAKLDADPKLREEHANRLSAKGLSTVPELFFSTKKRHLPDILECRVCGHQFPREAACPECNSTDLALFMRAPSRRIRPPEGDRESALTELDPDWRERFGDDVDLACEFYK